MTEGIDNPLLERFEQEVWSKVPHLEEKDGEAKVVNATPLVDITEDFKECAKNVYKLNLDDGGVDALENFYFAISNRIQGEIEKDIAPFRPLWNGFSDEWKY